MSSYSRHCCFGFELVVRKALRSEKNFPNDSLTHGFIVLPLPSRHSLPYSFILWFYPLLPCLTIPLLSPLFVSLIHRLILSSPSLSPHSSSMFVPSHLYSATGYPAGVHFGRAAMVRGEAALATAALQHSTRKCRGRRGNEHTQRTAQ